MTVSLLSSVVTAILAAMGWKMPSQQVKDMVNAQKRIIYVFPHTTYWDTVLFSVVNFTDPEFFSRFKFLINPTFYGLFSSILGTKMVLRSSRIEEKGGLTDKLVEQLSKCDRFVLIMSPEGTTKLRKWKEGYYHIARQVEGTVIGTFGADYERREIVFHASDYFVDPRSGSLDVIEKELKDNLSGIVPLYPERSVVPVKRSYNPDELSCIDYVLFTNVIGSIAAIHFAMRSGDWLEIILVICSTISSCLYHWGREADPLWKGIDATFAWSSAALHMLKTILYFSARIEAGRHAMVTLHTIFWLATIGCYLKAISSCGPQYGRANGTQARSRGYILYHSLFHLFGCATFCAGVSI